MLAEKMNMVKVTDKPQTTILKKGNAVMKKELAVKTSVFEDTSTINMIKFFNSRMKAVLIADSVNSIRHKIGINFDKIFSTEDIRFLETSFDGIVKSALEKANTVKPCEFDISEFETILTEEELSAIKERLLSETKEYTFEELKEYIVYSFDEITINMIRVFESINIR